MKRPRSYGEDLDEDVGEKRVFKDWVRRDHDPDRPSSHRRFYPKAESVRKGSSSSHDRSVDDDLETSRAFRKRFDHEGDGFDRRKVFDRYRDGGDRSIQVSSSPRCSYGGDRLHRSESFSVPRREFPKGFRSERDRSRREGSSGSSWRRSSGGKEAVDEELRSPSVDSVGRGNCAVSGDRGNTRSKDSSSGEQSRSVETTKTEEARRESCSSSEMEEGELEPDPEPELEPESSSDPKPLIGLEEENSKSRDIECKVSSEASTANKASSTKEEKLGFDEEGVCDGKAEGKLVETAMDQVDGIDEVLDLQNDSVKELNEKETGGGEGDIDGGEENVEANLLGAEQEIVEEQCLRLPSQSQEQEGQGEERTAEEEGKGISVSVSLPLEGKLEEKQDEGRKGEVEPEFRKKEEAGIDLEVEQNEGKAIDLEIEPEGTVVMLDSSKEGTVEKSRAEVTLKLMTDWAKENCKDKGKSLVVSLFDKAKSAEEEDAMEGPSSRGFELFFCSDVMSSEKANHGGKHKDEKLKLEPLELSLGLPGTSLDQTFKHPNPNSNSPSHARSIQSLPSSSFRTNSDGFTTSISFSGSQPFVHNPSCSLTHNSLENYEHSVGSHPIFQGVDQVSNGTIWQGQSSNEPKQKGGTAPLFQRILLNTNGPPHPPHAVNGLRQSKNNGLSRQSSLPRQLSPTHSHGSHDTRSEHSKDKRPLLTRARSSSNLFKSEQREGEQPVLHGVGIVERIVNKIVAEPVQLIGRMLQEMTEQSVAYLKETICEMVGNADKHGQLRALQELLRRRPDLTIETLSNCHRTLLEILVALKTGLPHFLRRTNNIPTSDLAEIFLNLKCRNVACRTNLPVDECECKVCTQKNGFCSACMCLVCSKFDMASDTCSWVGCDVCLHWCHTDCGLRNSHIRNGQSVSGIQGMTEMQFHCVACDHPSEMFGFVKDVFKTCAKDWKAENLVKELQCVRRIFSASDDVRGKKLRDMADQMLVKLQDKANLSEVINFIMKYFTESESNFSNSPSSFPPKDPPRKNAEGSNGLPCSSKGAIWLPSVSSEKVPRLKITDGVLSSLDCDPAGRKTRGVEVQVNLEKKPVVDELESVVRFKLAEAKMYQERADDARREAESLKRIAIAKTERINEDYGGRVTKLRLDEAKERRKQKLEEFQVLERAHFEYLNMKMRMETNINDLLLKMEATKRNFNT